MWYLLTTMLNKHCLCEHQPCVHQTVVQLGQPEGIFSFTERDVKERGKQLFALSPDKPTDRENFVFPWLVAVPHPAASVKEHLFNWSYWRCTIEADTGRETKYILVLFHK